MTFGGIELACLVVELGQGLELDERDLMTVLVRLSVTVTLLWTVLPPLVEVDGQAVVLFVLT